MSNIITEKSVSLSNGFQSGQWVKFLTQTPTGEWVEEKVVGTGECTWHDDPDISDMKVSLEGKRGILGGFRGVSSLSYVTEAEGFFGFTAEELAAPAPETGYSSYSVDFNAHKWAEVKTLGEYLTAKFVGHFTPWSAMKDGVHRMPYEWGDQPADSYALVIGGKLVDSVTGCGDGTPYLTESEEKCLADRKLYTSCPMEDERAEREEAEKKFFAMLEKLGLTPQYNLLNNAGYSEVRDQQMATLCRQVETAIIHAEADARADADSTGVLRRLLSHYRSGMNPLRSLRKEKGGTWMFHRSHPCPAEGVVIYHGDEWWVTWAR